jgi:hypothetical protein
MEFHPAANIFPMMTGDDYRALVESIQKNGYDRAFPILTFEGMILDGRNRYTACLELGMEPKYQEWSGDDPWKFVWLANSERRHLTQMQKVLIKRRQLDGQAEWLESKEHRQEEANAARSEFAQQRPRDENGSFTSVLSNDKRLDNSNWEHQRLAQEAGVSPATAARAQSLDNARPDLADLIIAGTITPAQAEVQRRRDEADKLRADPIPPPIGKYATVVIDPPWPMQKIEREVAPNQYAFDYPVMEVEDIAQLRILDSGEIAVRIRRANVRWRDLTIRSRIGHAKTEIHKIREGFGRYYLYCWTNESNIISDWILVDLNQLRESGLLENRKEITNKDGYTAFINIPAIELAANGCLLASKV